MRVLARKSPNAARRPICSGCWRLDAPLLRLTTSSFDHWTIGDSLEHVLIFGGTGSGKTSATGKALACAFLKAGYGGLVLCAKPDEASRWETYARECGRPTSIIRLDAAAAYRFNFLDYLMALPPEKGGGLVDNVVNAFVCVLESAHNRDGSSSSQNHGEGFWLKAVRALLTNSIGSLYHAYGRVTLDDLIKLVNSVPMSEEQARDPSFQTWSFCYATMRKLFDDPKVPLPQREAAQYVSYFGQTFGRLDSKTRSNILITLDSEISPFMRGPLHTLFCTDTNFHPEVTHAGVVLVLDLPVKRFEHMAVVAQTLIKYIWQKATERRDVLPESRPVFLFADEAQLFFSSYDLEFQSTARSARAATVYITQNLPSLYARLGGPNPQDRADAIIGNFQTKIFHANTDHRTNQWAAEMIGRELQRRESANWSLGASEQANDGRSGNWSVQTGLSEGRSWGSSHGSNFSRSGEHMQFGMTSGFNRGGQKSLSRSRSRGGGWSRGTSVGTSNSSGGGWSEYMDYAIQPAFFAHRLRQGGERNGCLVSAILVQANRVFSRTGACWTPLVFKQE